MTVSEIEVHAAALTESDRRRLIAFLVAESLRADSAFHMEAHGRLAYDGPEKWLPLAEAERRLQPPLP